MTADKTVIVGGMTCNHCKMTVENNLNSLDKINSVSADIGNGHVQLSGEGIDLQKVKEKLDSLGYKYEGEI